MISLIDGAVADLSLNNRGFFHSEPDLTAWESISGHPTGLLRISKLFGSRRSATSTEPLALPLRHGIVHGRDINYNYEVVSAKLWATLFAVGDWARSVERGTHVKRETKPLRESLKQIAEHARETSEIKKHAEAWSPRAVEVPHQEMPAFELFELHTPERKLAEYLHAALKRRYGIMAEQILPRPGVLASTLAGELRRDMGSVILTRFLFRKIVDAAPALTRVEAECQYGDTAVMVDYRLLFAKANGEVVPRGYEDASWYVVNYLEPLVDLVIAQEPPATPWTGDET